VLFINNRESFIIFWCIAAWYSYL